MRAIAKTALWIALSALTSGCLSEEYERFDGVTHNAGNAVAANTAMQIVDPWQEGVQDTELLVPADRGAEASDGGEDGGGASDAQPVASNN
jgi:hypothetical protein